MPEPHDGPVVDAGGEAESAFAPPRTAPGPAVGGRRWRWFARTRGLRLAAAAVIWGMWSNLLWPRGDSVSFLVGGIAGVALWVPTSAILFRVVFFPGEPDPRVLDVNGDPTAPDDHRWTHRVLLAEHLLGAIPLVLFAVWAIVALPSPARWGGLLFLPAVWGTVWQLRRGIRNLAVQEASLDLALDRPRRARRWLEWLQRTFRHLPDHAWRLLAVAQHRGGDTEAAMRSLDAIAGSEGVEELRQKLQRELST